MPFARQRLLAPAIFLPWVVVALRSGIAIGYTLFVKKKRQPSAISLLLQEKSY
jgi:hypothetical protein